jgi:hypothetical protein
MPEYMLLLYAPDTDGADERDRWAEMPVWQEVTESLRKSGVLVANSPLHPPSSATTVRVRGGETTLTDGPFATTKETLAGFYILDCADLDDAVRHAAELPTAWHGSVEVRPLMALSAIPAPARETLRGIPESMDS